MSQTHDGKADSQLSLQNELNKETEERFKLSENELEKYRSAAALSEQVTQELGTIFAGIKRVILVPAPKKAGPSQAQTEPPEMTVYVEWSRRPKEHEQKHLADFLSKRLGVSSMGIKQSFRI